jgi:hypothetical protein
MANTILFITSCVMVVLHLLAVMWYGGPVPLQVLYVVGPTTSFLNHGTTLQWALWLDRSVMAVGCLMDQWYAWHLPQWGFLWSAIACTLICYAVAKFMALNNLFAWSQVFHVASHVLVTTEHIVLLYYYRTRDVLNGDKNI